MVAEAGLPIEVGIWGEKNITPCIQIHCAVRGTAHLRNAQAASGVIAVNVVGQQLSRRDADHRILCTHEAVVDNSRVDIDMREINLCGTCGLTTIHITHHVVKAAEA